MIKIKANDFLRDTILFGLTIILLLIANLMTLFDGSSWESAVNIMLVAIIFLNVSIFCSLIKNIRRDFALFIFVIAYDTLLLGRVYVNWISYYHKLLQVLEADGFPQLFQALQIVTISLFVVYVVYRMAGPFFYKRENALRQKGMAAIQQNSLLPIIRQLSVIILLVSSVAFFILFFKRR